jgi:hypothetical protein
VDFSNVKACDGDLCTPLLPTTPALTHDGGAAWRSVEPSEAGSSSPPREAARVEMTSGF